jgi:multiple sugar transport system permease protein
VGSAGGAQTPPATASTRGAGMATTMRAGTPEAAPARRPPRLDRRKLRQTPVALLFLAPALVVITLFHFFPIFYAFWLSLRNYRLIDQGMVWFKNYNTALHSHDFWLSLGNTIYYVLGTVPLTMALACVIAYLLFQKVRFLSLFRTVFFLPYVTSTVAAATVWLWIFDPRRGVANTLLGKVGIGHQRWTQEPRGIFQLLLSVAHVHLPGLLQGPSLALVAVMILTIWHELGFQVVIFLVGLGSISSEVYEAARMDGANERQLFFGITVPLLSPTIAFLMIISTIGAFQEFNEIYIMSGNANVGGAGGPLGKTQTVMVNVFNQFQVRHQLGYGSAIAFILFAVIMLLTLVQSRYVLRAGQ